MTLNSHHPASVLSLPPVSFRVISSLCRALVYKCPTIPTTSTTLTGRVTTQTTPTGRASIQTTLIVRANIRRLSGILVNPRKAIPLIIRRYLSTLYVFLLSVPCCLNFNLPSPPAPRGLEFGSSPGCQLGRHFDDVQHHAPLYPFPLVTISGPLRLQLPLSTSYDFVLTSVTFHFSVSSGIVSSSGRRIPSTTPPGAISAFDEHGCYTPARSLPSPAASWPLSPRRRLRSTPSPSPGCLPGRCSSTANGYRLSLLQKTEGTLPLELEDPPLGEQR